MDELQQFTKSILSKLSKLHGLPLCFVHDLIVEIHELTRAHATLSTKLCPTGTTTDRSHLDTKWLVDLSIDMSVKYDIFPSELQLAGVVCEDLQEYHYGTFASLFHGTYRGRSIVLKRVPCSDGWPDDGRNNVKKAIYRTALMWNSLEHDSLLPICGIANHNLLGSMCIVIPFEDNGSILDHISRQRALVRGDLSGAIRKWLHQVALGLAYLHKRGIVHGNLHGRNILIDDSENARLTDIGMTIVAEAVERNRNPGCGYGPRRWTAPELIDPAAFGHGFAAPTMQSDIYAFGMLIFQLYTGVPPFSNLTEYQACNRIVNGEIPTPPCHPDHPIPDFAWSLVMSCLSTHAERRPSSQSIADVLADQEETSVGSPSISDISSDGTTSFHLAHTSDEEGDGRVSPRVPTRENDSDVPSCILSSRKAASDSASTETFTTSLVEPPTRNAGKGNSKSSHSSSPGSSRVALFASFFASRFKPTEAGYPEMQGLPQLVEREVKTLLNKLTMESLDPISDDIIDWINRCEDEQDSRTLARVTALICEKAIHDERRPEMYARLCRRIMERISAKFHGGGVRNIKGEPVTGGHLFRKYLLDCCQHAFENLGQAELRSSAQTTAFIMFIGALYKLQMLTERIMHECVRKLLRDLENPMVEDVESLCTLLTSIGAVFDIPKARAHMDVYFQRMRQWTKIDGIGSDLKLMLQEVIELRERKWTPLPEGLATSESRTAALHEMDMQEDVSNNGIMLRSGKGKTLANESDFTHTPMATTDKSRVDNGNSSSSSVGDPIQRRKLYLLPRVVKGERKPFPTCPNNSEDDASEAARMMSDEEVKQRINEDSEEFFSIRDLDEADMYFTKLPVEHRYKLVEKLISVAIEIKDTDAELVANFFARAASKNYCSPSTFEEGFAPMCESLDGIAVYDSPKVFSLYATMMKGAGLDKDEERRQRLASKLADGDKLLSLL